MKFYDFQMDHNQAALPIQDNMDELDEIDDLVDESSDAFAAYVTEKAQKDREIVFNRDLGLGNSITLKNKYQTYLECYIKVKFDVKICSLKII